MHGVIANGMPSISNLLVYFGILNNIVAHTKKSGPGLVPFQSF